MSIVYLIQFPDKRYVRSLLWHHCFTMRHQTNNRSGYLSTVSTDNLEVARKYKSKGGAKTSLTNAVYYLQSYPHALKIINAAKVVPFDTSTLIGTIPELVFINRESNKISIENANPDVHCCCCGVLMIQMKCIKIQGRGCICIFCCEKIIPAVQDELKVMPQELRDNYKAEQFLRKLS